MTARYTMASNQAAAAWIVTNPLEIQYNGCGMPVELRTRAPMRTSLPLQPEQTFRINNVTSQPSYFSSGANVRPISATDDASVPALDVSHEAEYECAHRTLVVPVREGQGWHNVTTPDGVLPYRFLLVPESHGIYMQEHRRHLPAGTLLLFPIAGRPILRNGNIILRIDTLGIITSPYAEPDYFELFIDEMQGRVVQFAREASPGSAPLPTTPRLRLGFSAEPLAAEHATPRSSSLASDDAALEHSLSSLDEYWTPDDAMQTNNLVDATSHHARE